MGKIAEKNLKKLVIVTEIKKIKYVLLTKRRVRNKMNKMKHSGNKCTQSNCNARKKINRSGICSTLPAAE